MTRVALWVMLGALLVGMGITTAGWAAAAAPSWGVVDMDRVAGEYRGMQELNQQFQDFQREQERDLQEQHKARLLFEEERFFKSRQA